jgi:small GTP-binding protein
MKNIRNFCIIAHIDHGKSTLADRLLEFTHTIQVTSGQMLDNMDLEKERGITIKSHAIQMEYTYQGEKYILNLIDTPGHVDFSYEVSRSIAACEGALLIVDASQGVQAQTISNLYMAIEHDLEIIPVINKCDMASANPEEVEDEIVELLGCKREEVIRASGKTGMGVEEIKLSDFKGKKLALYFYPKDNTSGCTAEACSLRDGYKELQAAGYEVVGVSKDSAKSHQGFIAKQELPFSLIADTDTTLQQQFGVWAEKKLYGRSYMGTLRTTFIIDEDGIVTNIIGPKEVKTKDHANQILNL